MEGIKEILKSHGVKDEEVAKLMKKFVKETAEDEEFVAEVATELVKKSVLHAMKMIKAKEEKVEEKKKVVTEKKKRDEEKEEEVAKKEDESSSKKKKKEKRDYEEVKGEYDNGKKLTEFTIEDLKVLIRKWNETAKPPIKLDGKKEDLIQKVESFIDQL